MTQDDLDRAMEAMIGQMGRINLRAHLSNEGVDEVLRRVMAHLADSAKYIALFMGMVKRTQSGTENVHNDLQMKLDVFADALFKRRLEQETAFGIGEFASEEQDKIVVLKHNGERYSVAVDPLDGSSLIDVKLAVGTIIGIHEGPILNSKPGRDSLVAAMCFVYGPLTTLLYTAMNGVYEFVLDQAGNFVLSQEVKMEPHGTIFSPGGLKKDWLPAHAAFVNSLEASGYKLRYSGGLVPDFNQIILKKGGIFAYPALKNAANGKLRLLFEAQPLALLAEQAGGMATNGAKNILDIVAKDLTDRTPLYIGSKKEVESAKAFH